MHQTWSGRLDEPLLLPLGESAPARPSGGGQPSPRPKRRTTIFPRAFSLEGRLHSFSNLLGGAMKPAASTELIERELQRAATAAARGDNMAAVHHCHRCDEMLSQQIDELDEREMVMGSGGLASLRTAGSAAGLPSSLSAQERLSVAQQLGGSASTLDGAGGAAPTPEAGMRPAATWNTFAQCGSSPALHPGIASSGLLGPGAPPNLRRMELQQLAAAAVAQPCRRTRPIWARSGSQAAGWPTKTDAWGCPYPRPRAPLSVCRTGRSERQLALHLYACKKPGAWGCPHSSSRVPATWMWNRPRRGARQLGGPLCACRNGPCSTRRRRRSAASSTRRATACRRCATRSTSS